MLATDGSVAGYALFWHDPVTGVGMVEPVRVEDEHSGRGIGYAMISAGLDRLARAGATTLKIGWESARAGELYTRLGFHDLPPRPARAGISGEPAAATAAAPP